MLGRATDCHRNYAAVTYPRQYSATAWPYIGPFYPYPQVPLGWRKVTLQWDDGWWMLDFKDEPGCCWWEIRSAAGKAMPAELTSEAPPRPSAVRGFLLRELGLRIWVLGLRIWGLARETVVPTPGPQDRGPP